MLEFDLITFAFVEVLIIPIAFHSINLPSAFTQLRNHFAQISPRGTGKTRVRLNRRFA